MENNIDNIFNSFFKKSEYQLKEASDEQILLYKKAYKTFKEKNNQTKAIITLDLDTNTITLNNFDGIEMYKFGYEVAKAE